MVKVYIEQMFEYKERAKDEYIQFSSGLKSPVIEMDCAPTIGLMINDDNDREFEVETLNYDTKTKEYSVFIYCEWSHVEDYYEDLVSTLHDGWVLTHGKTPEELREMYPSLDGE